MREAAPQADLLRTHEVAKRYGSVVALRSASLAVAPGEIHALLGANGAGKSTLVKILSGVVGGDAGTVDVHGAPVELRRPLDALEAGLGTVFQDPALVPDLTVEQNLRLTGVSPERVRGWLAHMEVDVPDLDTLVKRIPLPILRLLDLARALAHEPELLMLDEITAALPGDYVDTVFGVMREWRAQGHSVLFITHRLGEVLEVCDRATVLRDGADVATVTPSEGDERTLVEAMLGEGAPTRSEGLHERDGGAQGPVVLEARELTAREVLKGCSLELRAGEILGVVGLEGQGQERLFDVLSGDRPFEGGELRVEGQPVKPRSPYDMIRRGVVLVPADRLHALLPQRSLRENLASALYNTVGSWLTPVRGERPAVEGTIERLEIDTRAQRQVRRLSGGNQQKVAVGRWLAAGFRTLLCFDPTRGIDIGTKEQIYRLLRELADDGAAILYYASEFTEAPVICDRIIVVYDGAVVTELDPAEADEATLLNAAHGLEENVT